MKPLAECALYTFIDSACLHGRDPVQLARELCEGGSDLIQLRAKDWPAEKIEEVARAIRPVTFAHNVGLVINDYLEIAERVGADICHFGQEDFFDAGFQHVSQLPFAQPHRLRIGLSSHAPEQAQRAVAAGADYIAIGPVFPTGTKPGAKPVSIEYVSWAASNIAIPWFAIGGINLTNIGQVLQGGATRICIVSAILNASDVKRACREFKLHLKSR